MWYNTEEVALAGVLSRPDAQRHRLPEERRSGSGTCAARSRCVQGVKLFGVVNNILDVNQQSDLHRPRSKSRAAPIWRRRTAPAETPCRVVNSSSASRFGFDAARSASGDRWRSAVALQPARRRSGHGARCLRPQRHRAGAAAAHRDDLRLQHRDGGRAGPCRPHRRHRGLYALSAGGAGQAAGRRAAGLLGRRGGGAAARSRRRHALAPGRQPARSIPWSGWASRSSCCCSGTWQRSCRTSACWRASPASPSAARSWWPSCRPASTRSSSASPA